MANNMRAYLKTEGKLDYRQCQIAYYTYSMFDTPDKYKVNVNVHIQSPNQLCVRTLGLDSNFENESDAINYGIEQGKKYIDTNYETGKISIINPDADKTRTRKPNPLANNRNLTAQKKDQK